MKYSVTYDAYYEDEGDLWTEEGCGEPDCKYCTKRPSRPSLRTQAVKEEDEAYDD